MPLDRNRKSDRNRKRNPRRKNLNRSRRRSKRGKMAGAARASPTLREALGGVVLRYGQAYRKGIEMGLSHASIIRALKTISDAHLKKIQEKLYNKIPDHSKEIFKNKMEGLKELMRKSAGSRGGVSKVQRGGMDDDDILEQFLDEVLDDAFDEMARAVDAEPAGAVLDALWALILVLSIFFAFGNVVVGLGR